MTNFSKIKIGQTFVVDGETYKKHDELTYNDAYGLQRYIDPLFDLKIGKLTPTATTQIDISARIVKDTDEAPKPEKKSKKKKKSK